ncbi:MAG: hypothetical protein HYT98_00460 [Candidatus Sungbacteria bacterium]|nr:hypothetical protein [Candidatus Sungbacteria bacterium]
MQSETKQCQSCKKEFRIEPEDFAMYEKQGIPSSDKCPVCRWKYLLAFWVFGRFRIGKSALSGKQIITVLPENTSFPIYDREEFISDKWDPMTHGQDYDSNRSFFEQLVELQSKVPHPHQTGIQNTNCQWADDVWESKNCYLCRSLGWCEDLSYGYRTLRCKNSIDLTYCFDTEYSYDCLNCFNCYKVKYAFNARQCIDSMFLYDCRNVQNCFMCWNLRNKKYHIYNKPYSKEAYQEKLKTFDTRSYDGIYNLKKEFSDLMAREALHRANFNTNIVNSTGNFLTDCRNCHSAYFIEESENCRYFFRGLKSKESIDLVGCGYNENTAVSCAAIWTYGCLGLLWSSNCRYSFYLEACEECENCFGCVGLRKKNHCILNKQYSENDYKALTVKIKEDMQKRGEWGKFMPLSMAYSGYNLSLANIIFPENEEFIRKMGGKWDILPIPKFENTISGADLPGRIDDVKDDIARQRVICPETGLSYNIAPHELAFYKAQGIPLPRLHFDLRTLNRFRPMTLMIYPQRGICIFCRKEIEHYYPSELGYKKIACVTCYNNEVI